MTPRVSVLMAVYNGEKYLGEAVESILGQTFNDFEFIILDDGSLDSTPRLLAFYQQRDPRVLIYRFDSNCGLSMALNFGIERTRGEFIVRMDADDVSLPLRLEKQVKFMEEHPEVDVLGTAFTLIDESGNHVRSTVFSANSDILRWNLLFFNPIAHPSAMMRSSTIRGLGGYSTKLTSAQDFELWTRVILAGRLANLEEVHMLLRLHEGRVTSQHRTQQIAFTNDARQEYLRVVLNKHIPDEAITNLRQKPTTARHAAMTAGIILDYCSYCSKAVPVPIALRITGSALEKTARKIGRFVIYPTTWGIGLRFCLLLLRFTVVGLMVAWVRLAGILRRRLLPRDPGRGRGFRYE